MRLEGLDAVRKHRAKAKAQNLDQWYSNNPWAKRPHNGNDDRDERDFCDEDYPGPGLEATFFEIPNM